MSIERKGTDTIAQFHRGEYTVNTVKDHLKSKGLLVRLFEAEDST